MKFVIWPQPDVQLIIQPSQKKTSGTLISSLLVMLNGLSIISPGAEGNAFPLPLLGLCLRGPVDCQTCPNASDSARLMQTLLFAYA